MSGFFIIFFRYNKKPPFRAVYYLRVIVLQNVMIIEKASCLTPFRCFYVFSASCSDMACAVRKLCHVKVFTYRNNSAPINSILYAD